MPHSRAAEFLNSTGAYATTRPGRALGGPALCPNGRAHRPDDPGGSAIGAGRDRRPKRRLSQMVSVREEPKLSRRWRIREPALAQREKPAGPRDVDSGHAEVTRPADHCATTRLDERARRGRTDAWDAHQDLVRRARDLGRASCREIGEA